MFELKLTITKKNLSVTLKMVYKVLFYLRKRILLFHITSLFTSKFLNNLRYDYWVR